MRVAGELDPILHDIVSTARVYFRPRRVILFGSRARGDATADSDYDILVETTRNFAFDEAWNAMQPVRDAHHVAIDVHTRAPGELERRAVDPGWIDRAIAAEGVLLYGEPAGVSDPEQPRQVREQPSGEWESVGDWMAAAAADMTIVEHLMAQSAPVWTGVGYHAQQAAEKSLKAALVMRDRVPPRTHDLETLLAELIEGGAAFDHLAEDCKRLQPYFLQGRYPGTGSSANEAKARALVESARRIISAVSTMRL